MEKAGRPTLPFKAIPLLIIYTIISISFTDNTVIATQAICDMAIIAFFYLLRPGKYTGTLNDDAAFTLGDVQLWIGRQFVCPLMAPIVMLQSATSAFLTFTTQKIGVRGEVINHATSGASHCCPVRAIVRRIVNLRHCATNASIPITTYHINNRRKPVRPADITSVLKQAARLVGDGCGLTEADISAHSLCASGAMALLCAQVDANIIKFLGRW
jgi:hypothetical protein